MQIPFSLIIRQRLTSGAKAPRSHVTAPLETGMSKRTFQTIPVSQNNAVTHKYHPTPVWADVNIRYKAALSRTSPTQLLFILHTWTTSSYIYFFPKKSHSVHFKGGGGGVSIMFHGFTVSVRIPWSSYRGYFTSEYFIYSQKVYKRCMDDNVFIHNPVSTYVRRNSTYESPGFVDIANAEGAAIRHLHAK